MSDIKSEPGAQPAISAPAAEIIRIVEAIKAELRCGICCSTVSTPVITTCNHLFCKSCFTECMRRLKSFNCPMCKQKLHRRNCSESESHNSLILHYLQLAKAFQHDLSPLSLKPADKFIESQAPLPAAGAAPSPLRSFVKEHSFAVPALPAARSRRKRPVSDGVGLTKRPKLEMIGEDEEPPSVQRQPTEPPKVPALRSVKTEPAEEKTSLRRSPHKRAPEPENSLAPVREQSAPVVGEVDDSDTVPYFEIDPLPPQPLPTIERPLANVGDHLPAPLVPYTPSPSQSQASTHSSQQSVSVVPATPTQRTPVLREDREVQTDEVSQVDVEMQCEMAPMTVEKESDSLIVEIAEQRVRASVPSTVSDLEVLCGLRPELIAILRESQDELRCLFLPSSSSTSSLNPVKPRSRLSEILSEAFATPKTPAPRNVSRRPSQRTEPVCLVLSEGSRGSEKENQDGKVVVIEDEDDYEEGNFIVSPSGEGGGGGGEEMYSDEEGSRSVQAERGVEDINVVTIPEEEENNENEEKGVNTGNEEKGKKSARRRLVEEEEEREEDETIEATPSPCATPPPLEEPPERVVDVAMDNIATPGQNDSEVDSDATIPYRRRSSRLEEKEKELEEVKPPQEEEQDSFNESLVFDTVPQPLGETNHNNAVAALRTPPNTKSPSKRRRTSSTKKGKRASASKSQRCLSLEEESPSEVTLTAVGVTSGEAEELLGDFRRLFPTVAYAGTPEAGANLCVVLDIRRRELPQSSLQLAAAHACRCMVVGKEWMEECVERRKLLETSTFALVSGHRGQVAAWQRAKLEPPLFAGCTFLLPQGFSESPVHPRERLVSLIERVGGTVVDRPWMLPKNAHPIRAGRPIDSMHEQRAFILFATESTAKDAAMRFERDTSIVVFSADWIVDSLSAYAIVITDIGKYRVACR